MSSVDLPEPEAPTIATSSPRPTSRSRPCRATTSTPSEEKMRTRLSQRMSGPSGSVGCGGAGTAPGARWTRGHAVSPWRRWSARLPRRADAASVRRASDPMAERDQRHEQAGERVGLDRQAGGGAGEGGEVEGGREGAGHHHADEAAGDDPDGEQRQHLGPGEAALSAVRQAHRAQPDRQLGALGPGRREQQQDGEEGQHRGEQHTRRGRWRRPGSGRARSATSAANPVTVATPVTRPRAAPGRASAVASRSRCASADARRNTVFGWVVGSAFDERVERAPARPPGPGRRRPAPGPARSPPGGPAC